MHDVCTHSGGSGLTVSSGYAQTLMSFSKSAKNLSTLLKVKAIAAEKLQLCVVRRYGRSIYNQRLLGVKALLRYHADVVFVMYQHTLLLQLSGEF